MRDALVFYVNGARHEVRGEAAGRTLSDYLRGGCGRPDGGRLVGTKIACAEGDCGACTVLVGKPTAEGDELEYRTVDACIAFVYQMDRRHVVTVEGLQRGAHLSDVQQAMVDCHGSQCGFCTPGFVMALHGLVEASDAEGSDSGKPLTDDALRLGLSGNLCRCTGYSQILDAGRRLNPTKALRIEHRYDSDAILDDFDRLGAEPVHVNPRPDTQANGHGAAGDVVEVFLPKTLDQLVQFRTERPAAKLVGGATDIGVQHNHGRLHTTAVIATAGVADLDRLEVVDGEVVIGAAVPWARVEAWAKEHLPEYHAVLERFGSPQVRNLGTLVGNLANASPIADSIPFHYVAGATLELVSADGLREVPIESFYLGYKQLSLRADEVIAAVRTPLPTESVRLKLYKVSKRRDMDISTVTMGFWLEMDGGLVTAARLAAGGVGPTVVRLPQAEEALTGRAFTLDAMQLAGRIARGEITPISDVRGGAEYRLRLVENLFAKCWHELAGEAALAEST